MKFNSVFDIIGPVMTGPSSSHTAGAVRIGKAARTLFGKEPTWSKVYLYVSFAKNYRGHGTDLEIAGGNLGVDTDDEGGKEVLGLSIAECSSIEYITADVK